MAVFTVNSLNHLRPGEQDHQPAAEAHRGQGGEQAPQGTGWVWKYIRSDYSTLIWFGNIFEVIIVP